MGNSIKKKLIDASPDLFDSSVLSPFSSSEKSRTSKIYFFDPSEEQQQLLSSETSDPAGSSLTAAAEGKTTAARSNRVRGRGSPPPKDFAFTCVPPVVKGNGNSTPFISLLLPVEVLNEIFR